VVGGGVHGKAVGIAHAIIIRVGFLITMYRAFIMMSTQVGEYATDPIIGTATDGTMNGFLIENFSTTGRTGIMTGIGNGKGHGVSRLTNLDRINRSKN
jgi:hypothetical protein